MKATKSLYGEIPQAVLLNCGYMQNNSYANMKTEYEQQERKLSDIIDNERVQFNEAEQEIMECMIRLVEEGEADELYEKIALVLGIEQCEVMNSIHSIRRKMIEKKIVRKGKEYRFNDEVGEEK